MKRVNTHIPVLVKQVVQYLINNPSGIYVDGTLGGAGHGMEILKHLHKDGKLIGIDWDEQALERAKKRLQPFLDRCIIRKANFAELKDILKQEKIDQVDGILLDLGISSFQIESSERGFSYLLSGPLDMRMSSSIQKSAAEIINSEPLERLVWIFKNYGEERKSRTIARAIVNYRQKRKIETTKQLTEIIESVTPVQFRVKTLARIFQALRIATNLELDNLTQFLNCSLEMLRSGGRLVVISFHSLEDRLVKKFFVHQAKPCQCPPELPFCVCGKKPTLKILTRRAIKPSANEIQYNPRSRSSKLRAAEKI